MSCSCFSLTQPKCQTKGNPSKLHVVDKAIEKHMKISEKIEEKTVKVLLLGPGSSGKTTILKQIKQIHHDDDKQTLIDRGNLVKPIQCAIVEYMKILCQKSVILHEKHAQNTLIEPQHEDIAKDILNLAKPYTLTRDVVFKMETLWNDEGIKQTLNQRCHFQIHDNVAYFLDRIKKISCTDYLPDFDDYLRFRQVTTGFSQSNITINCGSFGECMFQFTDVGGQRSERKKWMKFVSEDINAVLYIIAISDYDLNLFEDQKTNCLIEAIDLFRKVMVKGDFFAGKSMIIFFNKYDLFREKIKKIPITVAFDDFPVNDMNPNNEDEVIRFVAGKFLRVFQEHNILLTSPLHIIRTTALDTNNIEKIVRDITMDLVQQTLKLYGIM